MVTRIFLFLIIGSTSAVAQSLSPAEFPISGTNPKIERDFPGGRGENELIIYDSEYGKATTGTNGWGAEVIVRGGIAIAVGGNNSPIRRGEFVMSGHGAAKDWLVSRVQIGSKVVVRDNRVVVSFDNESFRYFAEDRLRELAHKYERLQKDLGPTERNRVEERFSALRKLISPAKDVTPDSLSLRSGLRTLDELEYALTLSPRVEGRGVWHRPNEKSAQEVEARVEKLAMAGINMIFLETVWRGETIYPGHVTEQKNRFAGFDPLRAFIDAGKRHGIEVHAWIHTFFVGYVGPNDEKGMGPILARHPEWVIVKRNGEKVSKAEDGYVFICPARPEVQDLIASLYKEIRTLYPDIAGLQFDYIRYPVNSSLDESSCYCDYCRKEFSRISGVDPLVLDPQSDSARWGSWGRWREENITRFVRRVRTENPGVVLSAAVFPDIEEARNVKMQDWGLWAREKYVDFLSPMAYTTDAERVGESVARLREIAGARFPVFVGLAPFLKLTPAVLLREIEISRSHGSNGVVFFAAQSLSDDQLTLFSSGVFRNPATSSVGSFHKSQILKKE